ncbi:MAG TPA: alpha-glucosidase [Cyclobacteriaceae bacterium]
MKKAWWKEGVIYQIYPRSFMDLNNDGVGDLKGIISKLDYLKSLNIDIVWLSPVYQSPNDDNGYDISDYLAISGEFGDMNDFDELLKGLHDRGLKLVMDLVVNHTSDEHEWFKASRASKNNSKRDYYIWRPGRNGSPPNNMQSFFGGSAWAYDETTSAYYLHYFTKKQPDLNWDNPKVREEVHQIMRYWLDKGVDGFRMDVIPLISKNPEFLDIESDDFWDVVNKEYANGPNVHKYLREMNESVMSKYDAFSVGEGVGVSPAQANDYVGADRKELDILYHFGHVVIDFGARGKYDPVKFSLVDFKNIFNDWYQALGESGWNCIYLDNHDFPRMVSRFGNDNHYHKESAKLLITLLSTLRGTLSLYQGNEIGMTNVKFDSIEDYKDVEAKNAYNEAIENGLSDREFISALHKQSRDNARTPMQWSDSKNGGFTDKEPWIKINPNYKSINVQQQDNDPDSILNYYRKILQVRKLHNTWVYGYYESLDNDNHRIYCYRRWDNERSYLIILNFSNDGVTYHQPLLEKINRIVISNYPNPEIDHRAISLKPWESVVFEIN